MDRPTLLTQHNSSYTMYYLIHRWQRRLCVLVCFCYTLITEKDIMEKLWEYNYGNHYTLCDTDALQGCYFSRIEEVASQYF